MVRVARFSCCWMSGFGTPSPSGCCLAAFSSLLLSADAGRAAIKGPVMDVCVASFLMQCFGTSRDDSAGDYVTCCVISWLQCSLRTRLP
jgi:hypothetical protein